MRFRHVLIFEEPMPWWMGVKRVFPWSFASEKISVCGRGSHYSYRTMYYQTTIGTPQLQSGGGGLFFRAVVFIQQARDRR